MEPKLTINNEFHIIPHNIQENSVNNDSEYKAKYSFIQKLFEGPILIFSRIITLNLIYIFSSSFREEWDRVFNDKEISIKPKDDVIPNINANEHSFPPTVSREPMPPPKNLQANVPTNNDKEISIKPKDDVIPNINANVQSLSPTVSGEPISPPKNLQANVPTNTEFNLSSFRLKVTYNEKKAELSKASIEYVKKILQECVEIPDQLALEILPYLSNEHLKQLSLSDFKNEYQVALTLVNWESAIVFSNGHDIWTIMINVINVQKNLEDGPKVLSEIRNRFALIANGQEVKTAIENSTISSKCLFFLNSIELIAAYTFTDLIKNEIIFQAFPVEFLSNSRYLPEEKLRFAKFSFQHIQDYIKQIPANEIRRWNSNKATLLTNPKIWHFFSDLLSEEQIKSFDFDWKLAELPIVINSENYRELNKLFNATQKSNIQRNIEKIDQLLNIRPEFTFSLLGLKHLQNLWNEGS